MSTFLCKKAEALGWTPQASGTMSLGLFLLEIAALLTALLIIHLLLLHLLE